MKDDRDLQKQLLPASHAVHFFHAVKDDGSHLRHGLCVALVAHITLRYISGGYQYVIFKIVSALDELLFLGVVIGNTVI